MRADGDLAGSDDETVEKSGCSSVVVPEQAAELLLAADAAFRRRCNLGRNQWLVVLVSALVRTRDVIVVAPPTGQVVEMPLAERDEVGQTLSAD